MRRVTDDGGAIAVIMAFCMVFLIGMAAIVVDVGQLYAERRELQNGADAGALAIAESCARGTVACTPVVAAALADQYADLNAGDGAGDAALEAFDPLGQVTVRTSTRDGATGGDTVRFLFAPLLGFSGQTVTARATAEWGTPSRLETLPLTVSTCAFDALITTDPLTGQYDLPSAMTTLLFHTPFTGSVTTVCYGSSGQQLPGGFGWLESDGSCRASVTAGGEAATDPGNNTPTDCKNAAYWTDTVLNKIRLLPVYTAVSGSGGNGRYAVAGFAAFEIVGYSLSGGGPSTTPRPCAASESCLRGRFVDYIEYDGTVDFEDGGITFGATVFRLTG